MSTTLGHERHRDRQGAVRRTPRRRRTGLRARAHPRRGHRRGNVAGAERCRDDSPLPQHPCRVLIVVRRRLDARGSRSTRRCRWVGASAPMRPFHADVRAVVAARRVGSAATSRFRRPGRDVVARRDARAARLRRARRARRLDASPTSHWWKSRSSTLRRRPRTTHPGDTDLAWTRTTPLAPPC